MYDAAEKHTIHLGCIVVFTLLLKRNVSDQRVGCLYLLRMKCLLTITWKNSFAVFDMIMRSKYWMHLHFAGMSKLHLDKRSKVVLKKNQILIQTLIRCCLDHYFFGKKCPCNCIFLWKNGGNWNWFLPPSTLFYQK